MLIFVFQVFFGFCEFFSKVHPPHVPDGDQQGLNFFSPPIKNWEKNPC